MSDDPPNNAQALMATADALSEFSDKLDSYIKSLPDPFSPEARQLRDIDTHIAVNAAGLGQQAVEAMADDVKAALGQLNAEIATAQQTLQAINDVKLALGLVAAVLNVAANLASGNVLGSAQAVLGLVKVISGANQAATGGGGP